MINKINIMKLAQEKNTSSRNRSHDPFTHRIANDPYLDWRLLVAVTVILSCAGAFIGFISYRDVKSRLSAPVSSSVGSQAFFNTELFSKTMRSYDARADEYEMLLRGYSGVADPSL